MNKITIDEIRYGGAGRAKVLRGISDYQLGWIAAQINSGNIKLPKTPKPIQFTRDQILRKIKTDEQRLKMVIKWDIEDKMSNMVRFMLERHLRHPTTKKTNAKKRIF